MALALLLLALYAAATVSGSDPGQTTRQPVTRPTPSGVPDPGSRPLHVSVETWRFLPHSYGVVGSFLLAHLAQVPEVTVTVFDAPLYQAHWTRERGCVCVWVGGPPHAQPWST